MNYTGMEDLQSRLIEKGYRLYPNSLSGEYNICNWIACKRAPEHTRHCECNEKSVQFVVTPHHMIFNGVDSKSIAISIRAEYAGVWYDLQAYALSTDELSLLSEIEHKLTNAWEALNT